MIRYLKILFSFFSIFLIIGMIKGYQKRNDPGYLDKVIFKHIYAVPEQGHYYLQYSCGSLMSFYQYDIDSNEIDRKLGIDAFKMILKKTSSSPINSQTILTLLGGTTGGYTIQKIIGQVKKQKKKAFKEIVPAILGAISGYGFGFWIVSRIEPECDSPQIVRLLEKKTTWKNLEQEMWMGKHMLLSLSLKGLNEHLNKNTLSSEDLERFKVLKLHFDEVTKKAERVGYDFKSCDYAVLDNMGLFVKDLVGSISSRKGKN